MYTRYGNTHAPSSRYSDLVDIILILRQIALGATEMHAALRAEAGRRRVTLPEVVVLPGPAWTAGYRATATESPLPRELQDPAVAIELLATFLRPVLGHLAPEGTWNPNTGHWTG